METPELHLDDRPFTRWVVSFGTPHGMRARTALALALVVDCALFYLASRWFAFPELRGFDGSIICQSSPIIGFIVVAILLAIGTLLGTAIAGAVRFEAGLFAATFALMVLSRQCGDMQQVLFEAGGNSAVFLRLAFELVILGLLLAGTWWGLWFLARAAGDEAPSSQSNSSALMSHLTAIFAQVVATGVIIFVLCQSAAKNQAQASVGIASWLGAMIAYKYASARPSIWYWIGPLIVGILGYAIAAFGQDSNLQIGIPTGTFAPLARPLPLDYASVGVAGSILGYWMMRKGEVSAE
jgi:hypothetical protein